MADNDLTLKFGVDASGVQEGAEQTAEAVENVKATTRGLVDMLLELGGSATGSFRQMGIAAREAGEKVKGAAGAVSEFREIVSGVGEALIAAFAVEEIAHFAEKMGEVAEKTEHTAQTFGLTVGEVQRMNAEAMAFGVAAETMATAMQRLDRAFAAAKDGSTRQAQAFAQVGISIQGSYGQMQLLQAALGGLSNMDAGPAKIAAAMQLFGRNIESLGPLLGLTKDQLEEVNATIDRYGAVNEVAASKGIALAEMQNENRIAMMGLRNVMADAMAPLFTNLTRTMTSMVVAMTDSYRAGGLVKITFDGLAVALKVVVTVLDALITILVELYQNLVMIMSIVIDLAKAIGLTLVSAAREIIVTFQTVGKVISSAFTGHEGEIEGLIAANRKAINQIESDTGKAWSRFGEHFSDDVRTGVSKMEGAAEASFTRLKNLWKDGGTRAPLPKGGSGTTADDPTKPKTPKDTGEETAMDQLRTMLEQRVNEHDASIQDMAKVEADFWQGVVDGSIKAEKAMTPKEANEAQLNLLRANHTEAMNQLKEQIAAAKDAATQQVGLIQDQQAQEKASIDQQVKDIEDGEKNGLISRRLGSAEIIALYNKEKTDALAAINAIYQARMTSDDFALSHSDPGTTEFITAQKDEVDAANARNQAITTANDNFNNQMQANNRLTVDQIRQMWQTTIGGVVQAFGSGVLGMIEGTKNFHQVMQSVAQSILQTFMSAIERLVERWIVGELTKTTATLTGVTLRTNAEVTGATASQGILAAINERQIMADAAKAASGAYAATTQIPIVGPMLAPMAAVAAYSGVMAFENLASAAAGWGEVPRDGMMTELHKQEMVLPATLANPLRSALTNQTFSAANNNGGDVHVHSSPTFNSYGTSRQMVEQIFGDHGDYIQGQIKEMARKGVFKH